MFWESLEKLLYENQIVIDRLKGSRYPLDYGYLDNTIGGDGDGVDLWRGLSPGDGAVVTVDTVKRDVEIKLLVNCSEAKI